MASLSLPHYCSCAELWSMKIWGISSTTVKQSHEISLKLVCYWSWLKKTHFSYPSNSVSGCSLKPIIPTFSFLSSPLSCWFCDRISLCSPGLNKQSCLSLLSTEMTRVSYHTQIFLSILTRWMLDQFYLPGSKGLGFVLSPFYKHVSQSHLAGRLSLETYLISNWQHSFSDCR